MNEWAYEIIQEIPKLEYKVFTTNDGWNIVSTSGAQSGSYSLVFLSKIDIEQLKKEELIYLIKRMSPEELVELRRLLGIISIEDKP